MKDIKTQKPKKRKLQTEPNSPQYLEGITTFNLNSIQNINNSIATQRDAPMRLSANKISLVKPSNMVFIQK